MYTRSAPYYDALYDAAAKDYAREAQRIREIVRERCRSGGNRLLDVACGTGRHIAHLREDFDCVGLDVTRSMIEIAARRNPGVPLHLTDMIGFNLSERFDVVICLFGSIAYLPSTGRLGQTLQSFARHLKPGGIAIVEPWLQPQDWVDGTVHGLFVDEPELKVARMNVSRSDGNAALLNYHYMVASRDGIRTFTEAHRLTLFAADEYHAAFAGARLRVAFEEPGLTGRGLYVGDQGDAR